LRQFGTLELDRNAFHGLLEKALAHQANFMALPTSASPEQILAIIAAGKRR
jgi:leucyl/phenylalanyl-tRNA--protein transferase